MVIQNIWFEDVIMWFFHLHTWTDYCLKWILYLYNKPFRWCKNLKSFKMNLGYLLLWLVRYCFSHSHRFRCLYFAFNINSFWSLFFFKQNADALPWGTPPSKSSLSLDGEDHGNDFISLHPGGVLSESSPSLISSPSHLNPVRGVGRGVSHIQSSINLQPISDTASEFYCYS